MKKTLRFLKSVVLVLVFVCVACLIAGYASNFFSNSNDAPSSSVGATTSPVLQKTAKPTTTATLNPTAIPTEVPTPTPTVEPTPVAQIIYADDEGIQEYLALYNALHPEVPVTSKMLTKYYHHGRDHDDQVKFMLDGVEILVTNESGIFSREGYEISIFIDNPDKDNGRIKELFFMFMKIFDQSLADATLESTWGRLTDSGSSNNEEVADIECMTNVGISDRVVEYMKIEGTIPNPNSK